MPCRKYSVLSSSDSVYPILQILFITLIVRNSVHCACGGSHSPYLVQDIDFRRILVKEDTQPGTPIIRIKCKDLDNDRCIFGFEPTDLPPNLIEFKQVSDQEADIVLKENLDREIKSSYSLILTVTDNVQDTSCKVKSSAFIYVEDVNDEYPKFVNLENPVDVYENTPVGANLLNITATDADTSYFGAVTFRLESDRDPYNEGGTDVQAVSSNAIFGLGTSQADGQTFIKLLAPLDYEKKKVYRLILIARDGGGILPQSETLATKVVLIINVKDIQDTPPRFVGLPYIFSIPENSPAGTSIFTALAQDGDTGNPNKILYSILSTEKNLPPFAIDQKSGRISVKGTIDREALVDKGGAYFLKIKAEEDSLDRPFIETTVTITLEDVNDMAPSFNKYHYVAKINENSPKLTSVILYDNTAPLHSTDRLSNGPKPMEMIIRDNDLGTNSAFNLTLQGKYASYFTIDPTSAIKEISPAIRILDPKILDREQIANITLKIIAREIYTVDKLWSEAKILIMIEDINDEIPYFVYPDPNLQTYSAYISEGSNINDKIIRIQTLDKDVSSEYSTVTYAKLYGRGSENFYLNPISGWITLKIPLDREAKDSFSLNVEVRDGGGPGNINGQVVAFNRATSAIEIYVTDINDNAPQFTQPVYEALLLEGQTKFRQSLQIKATDTDQNDTPNSLVKYRFLVETPEDKDITNYFTINESDGTVEPNSDVPLLDYEKIFPTYGNQLKFKAEAYDSGIPTMSSFCELVILFEDANDNAPIFTKHFYSVSVPENLNSSQIILNVSAFDGDQYSHYNSRVNYFIDGKTAQKFWLDPESGSLRLYPGASLNLDSNLFGTTRYDPSYFLLNVTARDSGVPPLTSQSVLVNVSVYDVNDEPPRFEKEIYRAWIMENSPEGTLLKISKGKAPMTMNGPSRGDNPETSLTNDGDYAYELVAWDPDRTSVVRYDIVGYPEALDENRDPLPDPKSNKDSSIAKNILDYTKLFEIDRITGRVYLTSSTVDLDRERLELLKIRIRATDENSTQDEITSMRQSTYATLIIKIMDVNDNSPYWVPSDTYSKSIFETISPDERIGEEVINLEARDRDVNRTITYAMVEPAPSIISLNPQTGVVYQEEMIDFETTPWINFTVTATDSGIPPRISYAKITLKILDRNDNSPKFIEYPKNPLELMENSDIGTAITHVKARDEDSGDFGKVSYFITDGSDGKFVIDRESGVITIAKNIDREEKDLYRLLIVARDNGNNGLETDYRENTTRIEIRVQDENDNKPKFVTKYLVTNLERSARNTNEKPEVLIIREDVKVDHEIIQVKATDTDEAGTPNSMIRYKITENFGNATGMFEIDSNTGVVRAARLLTGYYGDYHFGVEAYDQGTPPLYSDRGLIHTFIEDANDHAPLILYPTPNDKIFIYENQSYGRFILQMRAQDNDKGKNGEIFYRLGDGFSDKKYFEINSVTGNITLQELPNKEERKHQFQILLEAIDKGDPPLSANVPLNIYVVDMDNHKPIFHIDNNVFKVSPIYENSSLGLLEKIPEAVDEDINEINKIICYFIIGGNINSTFYLNPMNRSLYLIKPLDRESISRYTLSVEATNDCTRTSPVDLNDYNGIVTLSKDGNDNMRMPGIENGRTEDWNIGNDLGRIMDKTFIRKIFTKTSYIPTNTSLTKGGRDEVGLREYFYRLKNKARQNYTGKEGTRDPKGSINIYSDPGEAPLLSKSETMSYNSKYNDKSPNNHPRMASDEELNQSILKVIIDIADVNDNPPVFIDKILRTGVTTDAKIGTLLHLPLEIEDRDSKENSNHRFTISNFRPHIINPKGYEFPYEPIEIDPNTGNIKTAITFKPNLSGDFNFSIIVKDIGTNFSDEAIATVYLLSPAQQILFVLSIPVVIFKVKQKQFMRTLENITGFLYNIDDMRVHVADDVPNDEITDIISHFVHPNGTVIDFNEIIRILDANQKHFAELKMEYDIEKIVRFINLDTTISLRKALYIYQIASYAAISSLVVMLIIFLILWLPEKAKYKKKLKAATAMSISGKNGHVNSMDLPGSNVNSYASSNPMWVGNYYNDTHSKSHNIQEDQSNVTMPRHQASAERDTFYSAKTKASRSTASQIGNAEGGGDKNEKILNMINKDIANIQQRILDEKSAALKNVKSSSHTGGLGSTHMTINNGNATSACKEGLVNLQYNTFGKKTYNAYADKCPSSPSSIYLSPHPVVKKDEVEQGEEDSSAALYQSPRYSPSRRMKKIPGSNFAERPLPITPRPLRISAPTIVTNDMYGKKNENHSPQSDTDIHTITYDKPPLPPPRQEQISCKSSRNGKGIYLEKIDASQI